MRVCRFGGFLLGLLVWLNFGALLVQGQAVQPVGLFLTEVYYDTPGDDSQEEWVEIANVGTAVIDLTDIKVGDEEMAGGREGMVRFPEGAKIEAGEVIVVAQTAVSFRALFGFNPQYEIQETDENVPNMRRFRLWAGGDVALANDGDEVLLVWETAVIDAINYEESDHYFAPSIGSVFRGQSIARVPANCDTDSAADWQPMQLPTPGSVSYDGECAVPINPALLEQLPSIGELQGESDVSPFVNQIVSFRGVVTGHYADTNSAGITFYTLFVQDLPGFADGNPVTSDGIAVFLGRERPLPEIGDQVRVTGQVTEFFGFTEIDDDNLDIRIEVRDVPMPESVAWRPDVDLESLESMRVHTATDMRAVGATFSSCGIFVVAASLPDLRIFQRFEEEPNRHILPVLHVNDLDCTGFPQVKTGDMVAGLAGTLIYHFDQFKLVQQEAAAVMVTAVPLPEIHPISVSNDAIIIANFNMENHFDAIDDTGTRSEPKPALEAITKKQQKLAYTISHKLDCPTMIGVQEVEHASLLADLAVVVAANCGFVYEVIHIESADVRGIDVALLTDPTRVVVKSATLQQACSLIDTGIIDKAITCAENEHPLFSRAPLQVDLLVDGQAYVVFINHFKSKRGGAAETASRRLAQAHHLQTLAYRMLDEDADARIIVIGDFNDYEQSDVMAVLTENGRLTNALLQIPDEQRYTFIFGGTAQLIDGILLSPALQSQVEMVDILHVNADYPVGLALDTSSSGLPFRASDHDVSLVALKPVVVDVVPTAATTVVATVVATAVLPTPPIDEKLQSVEDDASNQMAWLPLWMPFTAVGGLCIFAFFWWKRRH